MNKRPEFIVSLLHVVQPCLPCSFQRRIELINPQNQTSVQLFGLFYQLSFLLLGFRGARCSLVQDGALRKLTFHPVWDNLSLPADQLQDKKYFQIQPWLVALSCAMVDEESYPVKYFVDNGAGKPVNKNKPRFNSMIETCSNLSNSKFCSAYFIEGRTNFCLFQNRRDVLGRLE